MAFFRSAFAFSPSHCLLRKRDHDGLFAIRLAHDFADTFSNVARTDSACLSIATSCWNSWLFRPVQFDSLIDRCWLCPWPVAASPSGPYYPRQPKPLSVNGKAKAPCA